MRSRTDERTPLNQFVALPSPSDEWQRHIGQVQRSFFSSFDHTRALEAMRILTARPDSSQFAQIGRGAHFTSYLVPGPRDREPFVIKIPRPRTDLTHTPAVLDRWSEGLQILQSRVIPLIPPMHLIRTDGQLALVMPYGPDSLALAAPPWHQPLPIYESHTRPALASLGLTIGDSLQFAVRQGLAFLCDFSDLRRVSSINF